jgi:NAD(P)-dependent dehydrogenase (short-subunit alcohol dehydrogenase family)
VKRLKGRTAVITGAASGLGLAIAEAFLQQEIQVAMVDVDAQRLASEALRLESLGGRVHPITADVSVPEAVESVADEVTDVFGEFHIAVNNAGVLKLGDTWQLSLDEWRRVIDINLWGVIYGVRSFVPRMLANGDEGHLVNVASVAALYATANNGPYTVAKHGVWALSDVVRGELAANQSQIGVSVVFPGLIKTGMSPAGVIPASTVANNVVDAIRRNRAYVFTDDFWRAEIESRFAEIVSARDQVIP